MPIGDVSILEVVIRQLKLAGCTEITMAVGYLAELIMAYLGNGDRFGVGIRYSHESEPLGTAGPLGLVEGLDEPFLVMNGDLLTTLDFRAIFEHHRTGGAVATLAAFRRSVNVDLGVIEINEQNLVTDYIEKPIYYYTVSTGIYVFSPAVLQFIPKGQRMDLPDLVLELLNNNFEVAAYRFDGYWLDIGRPDDYEHAITLFEQDRRRFLPKP
jgi:NDP-sugar pyrophosphorylase family protein